MKYFGLVIAAFGVLLLLGGLAMPATQTQTSTTCIDSQYTPANGCIQTNYTTPNFGKGIFITLGLALTVAGGVVTKSGSGLSLTNNTESLTHDENSASSTSTDSLHNQIKQQKNDEK